MTIYSPAKHAALRAANRPNGRVTSVWGHRVRVHWWHDAVAGIGVAMLALAVLTLALAIL